MTEVIGGVCETRSDQPGARLGPEIAKVQSELIMFREECLPALLTHRAQDMMPEFAAPRALASAVEVSSPLSQWCEGVSRMSEFLPIDGHDNPDADLREQDFKQFMFQRATPSFSSDGHRIVWDIKLFLVMDSAHTLGLWPEFLEWSDSSDANMKGLIAQLPRVKTWLMNLDVTNEFLCFNAICHFVALIADADPSFARLALDREPWQAMVRENPILSDEGKEERLAIIDAPFFGHVLNNSMLHVLGALANNHFMQIRTWLDHPNLHGAYTGLMPHYLFAALFQKVRALRRMRTIAVEVTHADQY